jgi:3-hydroxymyristoyl/3-hydroxydecanoyl-(acyl carrier protein) dehydratase
MVEGCMQAMAFYLTALGYTVPRDGWVFEPALEETMRLVCRGQVAPDSRELVYEVFVDEVIDGPEPTLYAAVLGTVDGRPAMHSPRLALSLRPAWPIDDEVELSATLAGQRDPRPVATVEGRDLGYRSLVHCAVGKPSDGFGERYRAMDGPAFVGHLPAPPYHFMSRVARVDGRPGGGEAGIAAVVEYDVPAQSWYFAGNGGGMPFAVLLEVALQPCGWLAFFSGLPLTRECPLYFRNLDGRGTVHRVVGPGDGTLRTEARLTSVVSAGSVILMEFAVAVRLGREPVFDLETSFGFFDADTLTRQAGLPTSEAQARAPSAPGGERIAIGAEATDGGNTPRIRLLDEVTGIWPGAGTAGRGRARGRHRVDPDAWYFKAHFLRDPVQPGSLGLQAMLELLEHLAAGRDPGRPARRPRRQSPVLGEPIAWRYRGQVLPESTEVVVDVEATRLAADEHGVSIVADGSLWVDGMRVYEATGLSTRLPAG